MIRDERKKIRTVIVDDEDLARQVLREFLSAHPEIEIVAECANGFEVVKCAAEMKPDLLFLDIQMPKLDGFEVLELIGPGMAVVFVTAYDTFAIRAFEVHAVDYLLKPISSARFEAALERAKERLSGRLPSAPLPAIDLAAADRPPAFAISRPHSGARWHQRLHHPGCETRLRRSAGRLRCSRVGWKKTSEAADHLEPRSRSRSVAVSPRSPLVHREPRTGG